MLKDKLKAAGAHIAINLILFALLLFVLLKLWYPAPYFTASGGYQGLKIVALVDIVLGPILTFVIFNKNKKRSLLLQDIFLILVIQIGAFIWGTWTVYQQRPVASVFWENRFYTVPAIALKNLGYDLNDLYQFGDKFPVMVEVEKPKDPDLLNNLAEEVNSKLIVPYQLMHRYRSYKTDLTNMFEHDVDVKEIVGINSKMKAQLDKLLQKSQSDMSELHYLRLESKYHNTVVVLDNDGEVKGYLDAPLKVIEN